MNEIANAVQRLREINGKNLNKEYSLGDVLLLAKFEKILRENNWKDESIELLSPSFYIKIC